MTPLRAFLVTLLLSLAGATKVECQERPSEHRRGFFWGLGIGAAHLHMDCGRCEQLPDSLPYPGGTGVHYGFLLGGSVTPRVLLAGGLSGGVVWTGDGEGYQPSAKLESILAVLQVYPRPDGPIFLRGGLGISTASFSNGKKFTKAEMTIGGIASHLEVGWGVWSRGRFSIAPYVGGMVSADLSGPFEIVGTGLDGVDEPRHPWAIYTGVSATWY
jgi:hypothetical protein